MKRSFLLLRIVVLAVIPWLAWAGVPTPAPEPGTFELLALGGVAALVIGIRNRRKK
jgi:PEP-CTERM motif-containing protein